MALDSGVPGRDRQVVVGAKSIKKVENVKKKKKISNTPQGSRTLRRGMRIRYVNRYTRGVLILLKSVVMEVADRWRVLFAGRRWVCLLRLKGRCSCQTASSFLGFKAEDQLGLMPCKQRFLFVASRLAALRFSDIACFLLF